MAKKKKVMKKKTIRVIKKVSKDVVKTLGQSKVERVATGIKTW